MRSSTVWIPNLVHSLAGRRVDVPGKIPTVNYVRIFLHNISDWDYSRALKCAGVFRNLAYCAGKEMAYLVFDVGWCDRGGRKVVQSLYGRVPAKSLIEAGLCREIGKCHSL